MFFFKQKTAYEMRISDWSSDVCSSDLGAADRRLVDVDHLVAMLKPGQRVVRPRDEPRAVQRPRRAGVERVDDEARLARARQAGDAGEGAERDRRGDTPKVVRPRALQHQVEAVSRAAVRRHLDSLRAGDRKSTRLN